MLPSSESVVDLVLNQPPAWHRYRILEGAKGPLLADFVAVRGIAKRDRLPGPTVSLLTHRNVPAPGEEPIDKLHLSTAAVDLPLLALV